MPATRNEIESQAVNQGATLPVKFYPPRLSDGELLDLDAWAERAIGQPAPAPRFAAYLHCVAEFERDRRAAIAAGNEIVEAYMTPLPCPAWSNREVAHSLAKVNAMARVVNGETLSLCMALENAIIAECQHRLDPHGPIGPQVDRAWNKQ
jgi:hypothetical protein